MLGVEYGCFKKTSIKLLGGEKSKQRKKRKNKPYERAAYPGQKIQMNVKFVPSYCVADGQKYYQFTAKDECSRWTFRELYAEQSSHSAYDFLHKLIRAAPFPIRLIQTDNGTEFTNALLVTKSKHKTMFEQALIDWGLATHEFKSPRRVTTARRNDSTGRTNSDFTST